MMNRFTAYLHLLVMILFSVNIAVAGELVEKRFQKKTYPGSKDRDYMIFLPSNHDIGPLLPAVIVLHGCNQTHREIMHATRFNAIAEQERFIVVYPFVTTYDGLRNTNCWGYWFDAEIHQGQGEAADIHEIIREVAATYRVDPQRIHITGLSSGGAMATAVMVAYSEKIASGAPAAGIAYAETKCAVRGACLNFSLFDPSTWLDWWGPTFTPVEKTIAAMRQEMGPDKRKVSILILHANEDKRVDIQAALNNAQAWGGLFHVDLDHPEDRKNGVTGGLRWRHETFGSADGGTLIETHFVDHSFHGWIGGAQGKHAQANGPNWSQIVWNFFKTHPMQP